MLPFLKCLNFLQWTLLVLCPLRQKVTLPLQDEQTGTAGVPAGTGGSQISGGEKGLQRILRENKGGSGAPKAWGRGMGDRVAGEAAEMHVITR